MGLRLQGLHLEGHRMRARRGRAVRDLQPHCHPARLRCADLHLGLRRDRQPVQSGRRNAVALGRLGRVHDLQAVHVLQPAARDDARERRAVAHHVHLERRAQRQAREHADAERHQHRRIDEHARPQHAAQHLRLRPAVRHAVLRGIADEPARVLHLVHHGVARIHAEAAADAFVLQAVADVDAHGADLHAQRAIDAIAQAPGPVVHRLVARAARLAADLVVRDDEGVLVEHRALEARIGAHVLADLLAQEAGVAVSGEAVEGHPEELPGALQRHQLGAQLADGHEVAHEGKARPCGNSDPEELLEDLPADLLEGPGPVVEPQARAAVALHLVLDPHEHLGVHRLRAGEPAPETARHRGEQEQRQRRDDEQARQVDEILRIQHQAEEVEAPRAQVEQHHLPLAPLQPRQPVEHQLRESDHGPPPAREHAGDGPRVDLLLGFVEGDDFGLCRSAVRRNGGDRDDLARLSVRGLHVDSALLCGPAVLCRGSWIARGTVRGGAPAGGAPGYGPAVQFAGAAAAVFAPGLLDRPQT